MHLKAMILAALNAAVRGLFLFALIFCCQKARAQEDTEPWPPLMTNEIRKARLTEDSIALLETNRFVITDREYKQIFTPYISPRGPVFITSDSILNAFHVLYAESVFRMEYANSYRLPLALRPIWTELSAIEKRFKEADPKLLAPAKLKAQIMLGTALKLLGEDLLKTGEGDKKLEIDKAILKAIDDETARVVNAEAVLKPEWLGAPDAGFTALDYSRFKPRGFYARSERLSRYFRAVSWLQAVPFRVSRDDELTAIMLIGKALDNADFDYDVMREETCCDLLGAYSVFLGTGDDWDIVKAKNTWPFDPTAEGLKETRDYLVPDDKEPKQASLINDNLAFAPDDPGAAADPSFRILSAYRIPDGVMFTRTTDPRRIQRGFPLGLEVAAALGSSFARNQLSETDGGKLLAIIDENAKFLKGCSLYQEYMRCLASLVDSPEPDAPEFMKMTAWQAKSCQTVLSGWAQMRHTWALQAKQSAHYACCGPPPPPGFVEPEPEFFARLARLAARSKKELKAVGAFGPGLSGVSEDLREGARLLQGLLDSGEGIDKALASLPENDREMLENLAMSLCYDISDILRPPSAKADTDLLEAQKPSTKLGREEITERRKDICERAVESLTSKAKRLESGILDTKSGKQSTFYDEMDIEPLWDELIDTCRQLETLAHKQLRGVDFSEAEADFIRDSYGSSLAGIMLYGGNSYYIPSDDAPRIIDVFSNPNAASESRHLEVGIGRARTIYVLYPYKGAAVLCEGAVMPYYEFKHGSRLTDKEWKHLLDTQSPDQSTWLQAIHGRHLTKEKPID